MSEIDTVKTSSPIEIETFEKNQENFDEFLREILKKIKKMFMFFSKKIPLWVKLKILPLRF